MRTRQSTARDAAATSHNEVWTPIENEELRANISDTPLDSKNNSSSSRQYLHRAAKDHDSSPYTFDPLARIGHTSSKRKVTVKTAAKPSGISKSTVTRAKAKSKSRSGLTTKSKAKSTKKRTSKGNQTSKNADESEGKGISQPSEPSYTCMYCLSTKPASSFPTNDDFPKDCARCATGRPYGDPSNMASPSGAIVCFDCCRRHFVTYIGDNFNIRLYCFICHRPWDISALYPFVDMDQFSKLEERMTGRALEADPNFRWCASDTCTSGQMYDEKLVSEDPKVCCGQCESINCFQCRTPWHLGQTCQEYKEAIRDVKDDAGNVVAGSGGGGNKDVKAMRLATTKQCPRCKIGVTKTFGCDHMSCISCGLDFYWSTAETI